MNASTKDMLAKLQSDPTITAKDKALISILIQINDYALDQLIDSLNRRQAQTGSEARPSERPTSMPPC